MPRKYVNKGLRKVIDTNTLSKAIQEVLDGNMSIRNAATAYNVNYSSLQQYTANMKKEEDKPESSRIVEKQLEKSARASLGRRR